MGAQITSEGTRFCVYAPHATAVHLNLFSSTGSTQSFSLREGRIGNLQEQDSMSKALLGRRYRFAGHSPIGMRDGTWWVEVPCNLEGYEYTYTVEGPAQEFGPPREVVDPYAQLVTSARGRGVVVHDTTPLGPRPTWPKHEAIIYELHLRDFTIDPSAGVQHPGTYLGLTESGRLPGHPEVKTGFDHLLELGVNTVQIMPPSQFLGDEEYGWGYDSLHFNSPERAYAVNPAQRITEWKQMVNALHAHGIRVIVDMVWNHTMESRAHNQIFSFEGLAPGYYYRRRPDGSFYNGSGVGNEFRSEAPMARRFILDSARHWMEDLGADGFRLDLMGLIDRETMRQLAAAYPDALIYGEPWASGETPLDITRKGDQRGCGYSVFNDDFRDALKGHVFTPTAGGFVQTGRNSDAVLTGIAGSIDSFAAEPWESINYVECHDNHTLWDRLTLSAPAATEDAREAMDRLAAVALFTAQGIPFIQSGQEFRRTKGGEDNSYNLGDRVNALRWNDKLTHNSLVQFYRGLIALRRNHPMLRLPDAATVRECLTTDEQSAPSTVAWTLTDRHSRDTWVQARIVLNGSNQPRTFSLPSGTWELVCDGERVTEAAPLRTFTNCEVEVPARSGWILARLHEVKEKSPAKM